MTPLLNEEDAMGTLEFNCPECRTHLEVDPSYAGQAADCPNCSKPIRIPLPNPQGPATTTILTATRPAPRLPIPPSVLPAAKTSAGAVWSLVLGILSFTCFGPVAGIPGIICGHVALSNIKKSAGAVSGAGLAIAGFVLGYVNLAICILMIPLYSAIAIPSFIKARSESQARACINNLRIMDAAKEQAAMEYDWQDGQQIDPGSATEKAVLEYIKHSTIPSCPADGRYIWNPIGTNPECTLGGAHAL